MPPTTHDGEPAAKADARRSTRAGRQSAATASGSEQRQRVQLDHRGEAATAAAPRHTTRAMRRSTARRDGNAKTRQSTASATSGRSWIAIAIKPGRREPEQRRASPHVQWPKSRAAKRNESTAPRR